LVRAARAWAVGDQGRCASELARARSWLEAAPSRPTLGSQLSLALLDALVAVRAADVSAGSAALAVVEQLLASAPAAAQAAHPELTARVAGCQGELLLLEGELERAEAALELALGAADAPGCEVLRGELLGIGALTAALDGHLRRAIQLADSSDVAARSAGVVGAGAGAASAARAWVRMEQYDLDAARHAVLGAEAVTRAGDPVVVAVLALVRARLLRADGDLDGAVSGLRAMSEAPTDAARPPWLDCWLGIAEAELLVARGLPEEAVAVIEGLEDAARSESIVALQLARFACGEVDPAWTSTPGVDDRAPLAVRVGALLGLAAHRAGAGDPARARAAAERALRLAAPEQLRRPFREASPAVRRMLRAGGDLATRYPWAYAGAGEVGAAGARGLPAGSARGTRPIYSDGRAYPDRAATPGTDGIVDPLTKKEREVLGHLADLLSTDEIAGAMFVSVNTVRTHVRSILRKLGAARRNEAIRRAWELGLLPVPGDGSSRALRLAQRPLAR
jgi:LuxR family transcriptional regulator, maltose regulon positive regulatory protein